MSMDNFEKNLISFDSEIKLMKLLGASEEVITELLSMREEQDL